MTSFMNNSLFYAQIQIHLFIHDNMDLTNAVNVCYSACNGSIILVYIGFCVCACVTVAIVINLLEKKGEKNPLGAE